MSDGARRVSPSSLAAYAKCPRQYQYDKEWDVETPEASRRYLDRGLAYHAAIEDTCERVATADEELPDEEIRALAREEIERHWGEKTSREEYVSDAQYDYHKRLTMGAVTSYFREDGLEHARNSLAREAWLQCERDGVRLRGRADHVVRTDDGLLVIDYKGSLHGIVSGRTQQRIEAHHAGEEYAADLLKSVFQAATYIEGVKSTPYYEDGMEVEFAFYALLDNKERIRSLDGIDVDVSGRGREISWIYDAHEETIWSLIRGCYEGILAGEFEPRPWDRIREQVCDECDYRRMCGEYLGAEVRYDE